jgi:hypothetical protein
MKGISSGSGINLSISPNNIQIINSDPGSNITLTDSGGGTAYLAYNSTAPNLQIKGLAAGSGIALTNNGSFISITNSSPGSNVLLLSSGGGVSLVQSGSGPTLYNKSLVAGAGIALTDYGTYITVDNISLGSDVSLTSLGGYSLVVDGIGPALSMYGLASGTGISLSVVGNTIMITNTSVGGSVSISSVGSGNSIVDNGIGPNMTTKSITNNDAGITVTSTPTTVNIGNAITLTSAGGTSLVSNGSVLPSYTIKGLSAGTGINVTDLGSSLSIATSVNLTNAGGSGVSLVSSGSAPNLQINSIAAGTGISVSSASNVVTITNLDNITSSGGTVSLVHTGTNPNFRIKGINAGSGITVTDNGTSFTVGITTRPIGRIYLNYSGSSYATTFTTGIYSPLALTVGALTLDVNSSNFILIGNYTIRYIGSTPLLFKISAKITVTTGAATATVGLNIATASVVGSRVYVPASSTYTIITDTLQTLSSGNDTYVEILSSILIPSVYNYEITITQA